MSWSIYAVGRPLAVKEYLREKFAEIRPALECKPHEHVSISFTEEILNARLDFLIDGGISVAVRIEASGSGWTGLGVGSTEYRCVFETIPGFVE